MSSDNATLEISRSLDSVVGSEYGTDPVSSTFQESQVSYPTNVIAPRCRSAGTGAIFSRMLWELALPPLNSSL